MGSGSATATTRCWRALGLVLGLASMARRTVRAQCDAPLVCPSQQPFEAIHEDVRSICCLGQDCETASGLPAQCTPDCAVRLQEWWAACVVYISGEQGYAAFHGLCTEVYPPSCTLLLPPPEHGSYGSCAHGAQIEHSCGCSFECDPGYGTVGAQPYCEQGYLSVTARCGLLGCTDSQAANYDALAEKDDGSCEYAACVVEDLRPATGDGGLGDCPAEGGSLQHGDSCAQTCEDAELPRECDALGPRSRWRMCGGVCVPQAGCSYVPSPSTAGRPVATDYVQRRRLARQALDDEWTRREDMLLAVGNHPLCVGGNLNAYVECMPAGCTDSVATNYEPGSTVDDGSCEYTYETLAQHFVPGAIAEATIQSCSSADVTPEVTHDVAGSQYNCESSGDCTYIPFVQENCEAADTETCPRTDLSSQNVDISRDACLDAGCVQFSGYGFCLRSNCNYIEHRPMVEEACAATHVVACAAADISSDDPTVSQNNCRNSGVCTYVPLVEEVAERCEPTHLALCSGADITVDDWRTDVWYCHNAGDCIYVGNGMAPEACNPTAADICAGVDISTGTIEERRSSCETTGLAEYGHQACTYVAYVAPATESCSATDREACDNVDLGEPDETDEEVSRTACLDAGACSYTAFSAEVHEECTDNSAEACRAVDLSSPTENESRDACLNAGACKYTAHVTEACTPTSVTAADVDVELHFVANIMQLPSFYTARPDSSRSLAEQAWDLVSAAGLNEDMTPQPGLVHQVPAAIIVAGEQRVVQGASALTTLIGRFNVKPQAELTVRHIKFDSLSAPHVSNAAYSGWRAYGGAIAIDSAKVAVQHCLFQSNQALTDGGAIYVVATTLAPNTVDMVAGVSELSVSDSRFIQNRVDALGGAVYVETLCEHCTAVVTLVRSEFQRNGAMYGGALACGRGKIDLSVEDSNFYENGLRGDLSDLAQITEADLISMIDQMALNSQSEARFIAAFRELDPLNPVAWQVSTVSEWCEAMGMATKEAIIKSFIPGRSTIEGGAVYFEGRGCEATGSALCRSTVLDGSDDAANEAICEATGTSPQAASNGNHITCTYTAEITAVDESCIAADELVCDGADLSSEHMFVRRSNCITAGDCEYTDEDAGTGTTASCVASAKTICEGVDLGDARPATGDPLTGDELSCTTSCSTSCIESCVNSCTPTSLIRCNEATSDEFGECVYTLPVVGIAQACVATDGDRCGAADLSGDWRSSQRKCEAAGQCKFVSGETDVVLERCAFDGNNAQYGRHIQAYLTGQMKIRDSIIPDYEDSSVDIVSATVAEPGCRAYPCSPGEACRDEFQSTYCTPCPDGTISTDGIDCVPCPPGFGANAAKDRCTPCAAGLYSPGWGDRCRSCLAGFQPRKRADQFAFRAGKCLAFNGVAATAVDGRPLTEMECIGDRRTWVPSTCTATNRLHSHGWLVASGETEEDCTYPTSCESCNWRSDFRSDPLDDDQFDYDNEMGFYPIMVRVDSVEGEPLLEPATDTFYWSDGRECGRCNPGHEPTADRSSCRLCVDTFSSDGRQCLQCPAGSQPQSVTGASTCVTCLSVGPSMISVNGSTCESCVPGTQPNPANQTYCEDCPVGRVSLTGTTCGACDPGFQPNAAGYACETCRSLGLNMHSVNGEPCTKCPAGKGPSRNFDACVPCKTGYASEDGQCHACGMDYHLDVITARQPTADQTDCESCMIAEVVVGLPDAAPFNAEPVVSRIGHRAHLLAGVCQVLGERLFECNGQCVPITTSCDGWFWSEGHECRRCAPGYEPTADRSMCIACAGKFSADGGQCIACAPGTQPQLPVGAMACLNCSEVGESMASADGNKCTTCPAGYQPTFERNDCMECPAGRASLTGAACTACLPGSAPGVTRSTCDLCSAGTFSHDGIQCRSYEECPAVFNDTRVPAMLTGRDSRCSTADGRASRDAVDAIECEQEPTGYEWTAGLPSECLDTDNVTIQYNTLQPACEQFRTNYVWDYDWEYCREAPTTVWRDVQRSECLQLDGETVVYDVLQPDCEQSLEDLIWTEELCSLLPTICSQYITTSQVRDLCRSYHSSYVPLYADNCDWENVTNGRVWKPSVPAGCYTAGGVLLANVATQSRCYNTGRQVIDTEIDSSLRCMFGETGRTWTAPVPGFCTDSVNEVVVTAADRSACEFRATGYTWTDADPYFGGGAESCLPCSPGTQLADDGSRCEKCAPGKFSTNGEDCSQCYPGSEPMYCENMPAIWQSAPSSSSGNSSRSRVSSLTCIDYQRLSLCTFDGGYGPGWDPTDGIFSDWSTDGIDATQACCVCGGGKPTPGPAVCLNCSSVGGNMVSPEGNACVTCPAGFQPTQYREGCMECPAGRASLLGEACIKCLPGTAPDASRATCSSCGAGTFSHDGVACRPFGQCSAYFNLTRDFPAEHPLAFIPVALAGSPQCYQCPDGTERSEDGVACVLCPEGRHSMGGDPCEDCPPGYISTPHRQNCSFCAEAGTEPNLPAAATFCETCAVGRYSRGYGQFCTDCWANSHSLLDLSFCACNTGWRPTGFSIANFTGGDIGEGLDLRGDFIYAVDLGGSGGVSVQNVTFTSDSDVPGLTIEADRSLAVWGPNNVFLNDQSAADQVLVAVTAGVSLQLSREFDITEHPNPLRLVFERLTPKTRYRMQLLFVDKLDQMGISLDRGFDVLVDGNTVVDDFSPMQTHRGTILSRDVAGGSTGAVVTIDLLSNGEELVIDLGGVTDFIDGTNPFLQAFTLERGELNDATNSLHPTTGWVDNMDVVCTDTDECAIDNGGCDVLTVCTNYFGSRTCSACPAGFLDYHSTDFSPTSGNMTCIPKAVTGSIQKSPLREITLEMEADVDELGLPPHTAYMQKIAGDIAASLGLNASEVQLTSLTPATARRLRQLQETTTITFSFVILAEDESGALADLDAQLADPSSPLLNSTSISGGQDPFENIGVGCPPGMVIDPVDEVCTACALGQQVLDGACINCAIGYVGDGFQCLFCDAGSEPSYRNRQRAGDPANPSLTPFPAGTDCRLCSEIGPSYATDHYTSRFVTPPLAYCVECPQGSQPNENRSDCTMCASLGPNVVSSGASCVPCQEGQMPNVDRSACVACAPGEASNGTLCSACPAGYHGGNGTEAECQICGEDEFSWHNASESCTQCPSKSDTRGLNGQDAASACLCSGNPDNPTGGSYNSSLFFADGLQYFDNEGESTSLFEEYLEYEPSPLVVATSVWGRPVEVLSCWDGGEYEESADAARASAHVCVVCPACFNCSEGTGSEPFTAQGYWRKSPDSPKAHRCLYRYGCLGGRDSVCNVSYTGALCASCDQGYTPTETECWACPHGFFSFVFAAGAAVIFFSMGLYIIDQNNHAMKTWTRQDVIKHGPKEPELITVASRTLYAFLSVQSLTGDFRLNWPTFVVQVNEIQAMVAQPTVLMTFLKCIQPPKDPSEVAAATESEDEEVPWAFVRAIYMLILMPMFCILGPLCYFTVVHLLSMIKKMGGGMSRDNAMKAIKEMKASGGGDAKSLYGDKYFSMVLILLFILHPSIVRETLYLFPCQTLENDLSVLRANPGIVCGTTMHWSWMMFVAVPSFVFWCAGLPCAALYRLKSFSQTHSNGIVDLDARFNEMIDLTSEESSRLDDEDVMRRWGFLYRGYERKYFWWELVVTARKVAMVLIAVMLEEWGPGVQALTAMLMLQFAMVIHARKEPFTYKGQDQLETQSLACSFICLLGGMVFWTQDVGDTTADQDVGSQHSDFASLILTLSIVVLNVTVFVSVLQKVLVSQFRDLGQWVHKKYEEHRARIIEEKGQGKHLGAWHAVKGCFKKVPLCNKLPCFNPNKIYSASEERSIKLAKNAAKAHTREVESKGASELENLQRKSEAMYRCLWHVSKFKKQLEELKNEERGIPDLGPDVDEVNDWLDRLADTVLQEKTKTQYVREEVTASLIEKVAYWAATELPNEQPLQEPEPEPEPPPPLTIEDLEEIWAETSRGVQTESEFSNDAALLAALEADVKLRWAPGALDVGRGASHRSKKNAG